MMTAKILDGKIIAAQIKEEVKNKTAALKEKHKVTPGLAVIIVGDDPASEVYVKRKHQACEEIGIYSEVIRMSDKTSEQELLDKVAELNQADPIHGILVQLPLPSHINTETVLDSIRPEKDVDGFHPINVGNLSIGREAMVPCTPAGIVKMLSISKIDIASKHAVIIGRSNIVGKPMAMLLLARNATVTVCHSKTKDLAAITRQADILVAAVGKPNFVTGEMVKPGATVIDVGINRIAGKLIGDVDFAAVKEIAGAITPVPGGVGPLTISMLLDNTLKAAELQHGIEDVENK